jgi:hypothetical protein
MGGGILDAHLSPMGWHNEEGLDVVSFQEAVPLMPVTWLYLIVPIQARKGCLCDVNLPTRKTCRDVCGVLSPAAQAPNRSSLGP